MDASVSQTDYSRRSWWRKRETRRFTRVIPAWPCCSPEHTHPPSRSRTYSTHPNNAIIDLLTRCTHPYYGPRDDTRFRHCLGLKEEDSSPTRNAYKVRSFQVAIAAIRGTQQAHSLWERGNQGIPSVLSTHTPFSRHHTIVMGDRTRDCKPDRLFPAGQRICL